MTGNSGRRTAMAAMVVAVGAGVGYVWATSDDDSPSAVSQGDPEAEATATSDPDGISVDEASATATAQPEPVLVEGVSPSAPPEQVTADEPADDLAKPLVEVSSEVLAAPQDADPDQIFSVAKGAALDSLTASVAEYSDRGWSQVGSPEVVATEVRSIAADATPPRAVLEVCLDYSNVDVVDDSGVSVVDAQAPRRVLNMFTMDYVEKRWVLVEQDLPVDTEC